MIKFTLLTLALASTLHSATVVATLQSLSPSLTIAGSNGSGQTSIASGQLNFNLFEAFCVDTAQTINLGQTVTYTSANYWNVPNGESAARIVSMYLHSDRTPLDAASAQWAIWETLSSDKGSLLAGSVRMNAGQTAAIARASEYLSQSYAFTPASVNFLQSPTRQDMISFSVTAIPEVTPNSAILTAIAIGTIFYRRRKTLCQNPETSTPLTVS